MPKLFLILFSKLRSQVVSTAFFLRVNTSVICLPRLLNFFVICLILIFTNSDYPIFISLNFLLKVFLLELVPLKIIFKTRPYTEGVYLSRLSLSSCFACVCLFKNCINLLPLLLDQNHLKNCSSAIKSS